MAALRTRDTGQLAFAPAATSANAAASMPGTFAEVVRWTAQRVQPVLGWFSSVTAAVVLSVSATCPAFSRAAASAIVKHPACAAAISSSGLVPTPDSKREVKEYGVSFRTVLSVESVPLPDLRLPCQTADAFRFIVWDRNKRGTAAFARPACGNPAARYGASLMPRSPMVIRRSL